MHRFYHEIKLLVKEHPESTPEKKDHEVMKEDNRPLLTSLSKFLTS